MLFWMLVLDGWCFCAAQTLELPPRSSKAPSGSVFAQGVSSMELNEREPEIYAQIMAGNVPNFLRKLCPVQVSNVADGRTNKATIYVTPDYLAIGSDEDYLLMPMSPNTAQRIADACGCSLPTRKMVNDIYKGAEVKLAPVPMTPGPTMTTVPVFSNHNVIVWGQRTEQFKEHPLGALVAGHQKDVAISAGLASAPGKVAIYGWHKTNGVPIQPLYLKHAAFWVDYSQCIRFVQQKMTVDGATKSVAEVLADPALADLLSDEGTIAQARYATNELPRIEKGGNGVASLSNRAERLLSPALSSKGGEGDSKMGISPRPASVPKFPEGFAESGQFGERVASFTLEPDVKVRINTPALERFSGAYKVMLILYALPNGNTTEWTVGRKPRAGDDWHYDIQHIGAQTRFLRKLVSNRTVVVAYLEVGNKSWPAWRKQHGDKLIPGFVATVQKIFADPNLETVLSGHSGGGSFIFGYLNAVEKIPDDVKRIAFLDSNYAYDKALGHEEKLAEWLHSKTEHYLCVLAYNDAIALLDGKPFVSAAGGTWGRSHAMLNDLSEDVLFTCHTDAEFEKSSALNGRVQFLLKTNPERKVLHTVQVERNGFIHCMVSGTGDEGKRYVYFGERAYGAFVEP